MWGDSESSLVWLQAFIAKLLPTPVVLTPLTPPCDCEDSRCSCASRLQASHVKGDGDLPTVPGMCENFALRTLVAHGKLNDNMALKVHNFQGEESPN